MHAFIFDMDGVIVDSNPYHKIALKQFCEKHDRHLSDEELLHKIYGRMNREWLTNLFGPLPTEQLANYALEKEALFRQLFEKDIRPVKGLVHFLEALEAHHIPRAIGTSAPRANVDFILDKTGTRRFFKTILDDSNIEHGKPNPEIDALLPQRRRKQATVTVTVGCLPRAGGAPTRVWRSLRRHKAVAHTFE